MIKSESPDWIDEVNDIGFEITRALETKDGENFFLFDKYYGERKKVISSKLTETFTKHAVYRKDSNGYKRLFLYQFTEKELTDDYCVKKILTSVRKKLEKLNDDYFKVKRENHLYVYVLNFIKSVAFFDDVKDEINKINSEYTHHFDYIWIESCFNDLYCISKDKVKYFNIPKAELHKQAVELSKMSDWENGESFYNVKCRLQAQSIFVSW
jgi:hypothetical protein